MHLMSPLMSNRQRQVIMGTILGGSSIIFPKHGRTCYLSMRDKRRNWLEYKAVELGSLSSSSPFTVEKTHRWHSKCYPLFREFYEMFYKKGSRFLHIDTLSALSDIFRHVAGR